MKGTHKKYLYLSQTFREGKKVRQQNLVNFGAIDELNEEEIKNIAFKLLAYCKTNDSVSLSHLKEDTRQNWGAIAITKKLLEIFQINSLIKNLLENKKTKIDVLSVLNFLISERLASPRSKLSSYQHQNWYLQNSHIELHEIYRTLDFLEDNKNSIKEHLFKKQKELFKLDVSVVFYDVTTFYFESKKENELKKFGYSKDCKFNEVQVVVGALIDKTGRPLDYEVFQGNTYEGHTLKNFLVRMKNKYHVSEVIIVADRGLNSKENIAEILNTTPEFNFIVGHRIRSSSDEMKKKIFDDSDYKDLSYNQDEIFRYKIIEQEKKLKDSEGKTKKIHDKIIVTYSSKRAKKDKADRERLIKKARDIVDSNLPLNDKRGAKKYINAEIKNAAINEDKISEDSTWDGYYSIETSKMDFSAEKVLEAYHTLWRIEDLFRTFKTQLETRPVWHWTEKRIQGHFCLCFLALVFERTLEIECHKKFNETSPTSIREAINSLQVSTLNASAQKSFFVFSKISEYAQAILDVVGIKAPPAVCGEDILRKTCL